MKCRNSSPFLPLFFLLLLLSSVCCFSQEKDVSEASQNETEYWRFRALQAESLLKKLYSGLGQSAEILNSSGQLLNNSETIITGSQQNLTDIADGLQTISNPPEPPPEKNNDFLIGFAVGAGCTVVVGVAGILLFAKLFQPR